MSEFNLMQTLEVKHCPECHMAYAAPAEFFARLLELHNEGRHEKGSWTCPAGHGIKYSGEPEIDKVRRERDRLKQETARLLEEKGPRSARGGSPRRRSLGKPSGARLGCVRAATGRSGSSPSTCD